MARHYVKNPAGSATPVTDDLLEQARAKAGAAAARLRAAEHADPALPGWEAEYSAATAAARAAGRRVEALEQLRAAQVERGGQRAAAVKAAAKDLAATATSLAASRDQVAAAAAEHLRALAALASAAAEHNARLAESRARLAELGLQVHDDLGGEDHDEGVLASGLRAGGIDWTPVAALGLADHAVRQVFKDPQTQAGRFRWRSFEVERRADGLKVPTLADAGATVPEVPQPVVARPAALADVMPPREAPSGDASGWQRAPRGERKSL